MHAHKTRSTKHMLPNDNCWCHWTCQTQRSFTPRTQVSKAAFLTLLLKTVRSIPQPPTTLTITNQWLQPDCLAICTFENFKRGLHQTAFDRLHWKLENSKEIDAPDIIKPSTLFLIFELTEVRIKTDEHWVMVILNSMKLTYSFRWYGNVHKILILCVALN